MISHTVLERPGAPSALLVLLHGWDARPVDVEPLAHGLDPAGRFLVVAPQGPIAVGERFAWFEREGDGTIVAGSFREGLDAVDALIAEVVADRRLDPAGTVVAGFSQGGAAAVTLVRRPRAVGAGPRPAGVACLSGFLADVDDPTLAIEGDGAEAVPVLVQHGTDDEAVPALLGRAVARLCERSGAPVTHQELPMGHETTGHSLAAAARWLDAVAPHREVDARA